MVPDQGSPRNQRKELGLRLAFAGVLALMLIAGLNPGRYRFRNEATWTKTGPGLRFEQFGVAYTPPFLTPDTARSLNQSGVTLLLGLTIPPDPRGRLQFIASFHNGDDASPFVIVQWRNSLVVMNGNDYSHARQTPRVSADLTPYLNRPVLVAISTGPHETLIAADGEIIERGEGIQVLLPAGTRNSRLALGNSVYADGGWNGSLLSFGVLNRPLTNLELKDYGDKWLKTHDLKFVPPAETVQLLHFDEKSGDLVHDFSGAANNAVLPSRPTAVERSLLSYDPTTNLRSISSLMDFIVNLLGFIPFGLLSALFMSKRGWNAQHIFAAVVLCGFVFSLGIETVQAWIPTRSSSWADVVLNTLGAAMGAAAGHKVRTRLEDQNYEGMLYFWR